MFSSSSNVAINEDVLDRSPGSSSIVPLSILRLKNKRRIQIPIVFLVQHGVLYTTFVQFGRFGFLRGSLGDHSAAHSYSISSSYSNLKRLYTVYRKINSPNALNYIKDAAI